MLLVFDVDLFEETFLVTSYFLQYEGGIKVTSAVIRGIFALSARVGEKPDLTEVSWLQVEVLCT